MKISKFIKNSLLLAILLIPLSAAPAGALTGSIGGRPANPDPDNPRTQSIFIMTLDRNESETDTILVVNNSDEKQTVELYAVDGIVSNSGAYSCMQESETANGIGKWTTLDKDEVTLEPGEKTTVDFTVTMPENADVGEHNGCIVFQAPEPDDSGSGSIRVRTRQAVRLVATIPGDLHREVSIESFAIDKSSQDNPLYRLHVQNKGNVSADIDSNVTVSTLWGSKIYENGGGYPVIANQKLELAFEHDSEDYPMFGGWYRAKASIVYDKDAGVFGTQDTANLVSKETDGTILFLKPTPTGTLIIIALVLLLGGIVGYYLMRKRQINTVRQTGAVYIVKENDTIQTISQQHNISWKRLVAVNGIKPPYIIKPGQKIHVPKKTVPTTRPARKG